MEEFRQVVLHICEFKNWDFNLITFSACQDSDPKKKFKRLTTETLWEIMHQVILEKNEFQCSAKSLLFALSSKQGSWIKNVFEILLFFWFLRDKNWKKSVSKRAKESLKNYVFSTVLWLIHICLRRFWEIWCCQNCILRDRRNILR